MKISLKSLKSLKAIEGLREEKQLRYFLEAKEYFEKRIKENIKILKKINKDKKCFSKTAHPRLLRETDKLREKFNFCEEKVKKLLLSKKNKL